MASSIRHAFAEHGRFSRARMTAAEMIAEDGHERLAVRDDLALIHVPEGREEENFDADEPAAAAAAGEA
jgi:hypothetical protein